MEQKDKNIIECVGILSAIEMAMIDGQIPAESVVIKMIQKVKHELRSMV